MAFCNNAQMMYILPTLLNPIFKFFLKSKNLNEFIMSPNVHSTDTRTALMDSLNAFMSGVSLALVNGLCKCTLRGYAGSP